MFLRRYGQPLFNSLKSAPVVGVVCQSRTWRPRAWFSSGPLQLQFPVTPVPAIARPPIRTAAALIIGDEILNGKTREQNGGFFAEYCFEHGIDLKRIEVIADDEQEIIEASTRMVANFDLVVSSGGLGSTIDDLTYPALAKAFGQKLAFHAETERRLVEMNRHRSWYSSQDTAQRQATRRMCLFPEEADVIFVSPDLWVPVVRIQAKLCILPGIPVFFQKLLQSLTPYLSLPSPSSRPKRIQVFTERPETTIAPYLQALQSKVKAHGIRVGSYPVIGQGVFVSLIGREVTQNESTTMRLQDVAHQVEQELGGRVLDEKEAAAKREAGRRISL